MFLTYSQEQGEQVPYPQHDIICHRSGSDAISNKFRKIVKNFVFTSNLEVLKSQDRSQHFTPRGRVLK